VKILHLIESIQLGGAENVAFSIVEHCNRMYPDKFDFMVCELYPRKTAYSIEKKKTLAAKNIRHICLHRGPKKTGLLFSSIGLFRYILREKPDIVHSHTDLPDFVLSNTLRLLSLFRIQKPRIIRTIHNTKLWLNHSSIALHTEKMFMNDVIVGVSKAALSAYNDLRIKCSLAVSDYQNVVYNGCAVPQKSEHPFLIDPEKINVGFCGKYELQKGIDILTDRIRAINQRYENVFLFHIVGAGTIQKEVDMLSKQFSNVLVYDVVPEISDKLYAFDFLIVPSRFEGLGLVSLEATLSKTLVINSRVRGLDETLPDDWPLQFHLDKSDELVSIFENIANKIYDTESLKEKAFDYVLKWFSMDSMVAQYSLLYTR